MKDKDALSQPTQDEATPSGAAPRSHAPRPSLRAFLLAHGIHLKPEGIRVVAGIGLLVVAGVVAINVMV